MKTIYLCDIDIEGNLIEGQTKLVDRGGHTHVVPALMVPGYGWVPCSRKLLADFTNNAEKLALVINDEDDENPPYTSNIWITKPKAYHGDWDSIGCDELDDDCEDESEVEYGNWDELEDDCDEEAVEEYDEDDMPTGGSFERRNYRAKERSGFVTVHCFGPDGVVPWFGEYWCEPDETLDVEQELVYSQDGKRLLRSLNKDIDEYIIKDGVEIIEDKTFWGVYGPGEGYLNAISCIHLPNSIREISEDAFENTDVKIIVHIPLYNRLCKLLPNMKNNIWVVARLENGEETLVQFP